MKKIAIYGQGGLSKDILVIINDINEKENKYNFIGYFDDNPKLKTKDNYLGGINELNAYSKELSLVLAFGKPNTIFEIKSLIHNKNINYPNLIHPNSTIDYKSLKIGKGNVINAGTVVGADVSLENFNLINSNCIIGHDVKFKSYNVISPQVAISGNVQIQNKSFLGLNCSLVQGITIEDGVSVGAMSLMLKKGKKNNSYFGVPAVKMK